MSVKHLTGFRRSLIICSAVFVLLTALTVLVVQHMGRVSEEGETELVRRAIINAANTCYAVEGAYPSNLEYLKAHYALRYDEERYGVYYDAFASNIAPDIIVTEKEVFGR